MSNNGFLFAFQRKTAKNQFTLGRTGLKLILHIAFLQLCQFSKCLRKCAKVNVLYAFDLNTCKPSTLGLYLFSRNNGHTTNG